MPENTRKRQATKKKLQDSLMELFSQYEFQQISVTMLCKLCGLHRSTFYLYYSSVDEVLREIENDILTKIQNYSNQFNLSEKTTLSLDEIIQETESQMIEFYEWAYSMRDYLNPLLGDYGDPYFLLRYEQIITNDIRPTLEYLGYDCKKNPYLLKYITGGVLKTNVEWLSKGDISAKELLILQRTMVFKNPLLPFQH